MLARVAAAPAPPDGSGFLGDPDQDDAEALPLGRLEIGPNKLLLALPFAKRTSGIGSPLGESARSRQHGPARFGRAKPAKES
jgi:hypothetical protein